MKILEGGIKLAQKDFFEAEKEITKAKSNWAEGVKKSYISLQKFVTQQYPFIIGIGHEQARIYCDGDGRNYDIPKILFKVDTSVVPEDSPVRSDDPEDFDTEMFIDLFKDHSFLCINIDDPDDEYGVMADSVLKNLISSDDIKIICDAVLTMVRSEDTETIWDSYNIICCTDESFSVIESPWDYG